METGTVTNTGKRGFGYIKPDDPTVRGEGGMENIFYHHSYVQGPQPGIGDKVEFELGKYEDRVVAMNVRLIHES